MKPFYKFASSKKFFGLITILIIQVTLTSFIDKTNDSSYKLIVFEGSDWCPNCIQLEKKILKNVKFTSFIEEKQIKLEKIDFPQRKKLSKEQKKYNASIAEKYEFDGSFPTLVLISSSATKHVKFGYSNYSVEEMIELITKKMEQLK